MSLAASSRNAAPRRRSAASRATRPGEAPRRGRGSGGRGRRQLLSARLAEILSARARALTGLGLGAASILLLVALISYDPADPSLNTAAGGDRVANLLGIGGSYTADLLIQSLGIGAFLMASLPLVWAWRLLQGRALGRGSIRVLCLAIGIGFTSAAVAGVDGLQGWPDSFGLGGTGGILAHRGIAAIGETLIGVGGSTAVAAAAGLLGGLFLMLAMGLSGSEWRRVGDGLSQGSVAIGRGAATAGRLTLRAGAGAGAIAGRAFGRGREEEDENEDGAIEDEDVPVNDDGAGFIARLLRRRPGEPLPTSSASSDRRAPAFTRDALPALNAEDDDEAPFDIAPPRRPDEGGRDDARRSAPVIVPPKPAAQRRSEPKQADLRLEAGDDYELPDLSLLAKPDPAKRPTAVDPAALTRNAEMLERVLADFGVKGAIVKVNPGPVVTLYELEPAPGTKSSRVIGLADDIARSMSAVSVRVAVVPGRNVIGIELPNRTRETVYLREILASEPMEKGGKLSLGLGKDIGGHPIVADLARMPHLLVAGTTGSGKSVAINTMILSLLFRLPPERVRFIMVDPKMLELSIYDGIPHLLAPVVTDPKKAVVALKWTVREMEDRYRAMSKLGVRNIEGYNQRLREAKETGEHLTRRVQTGFDPDTGKPVFEDQPVDLTEFPYIVVVVDEMADLMLVAGKDIEAAIQRLAQMARAAGIHLIMATQRPSVDVITGTIKANFPTRISFQVTSKIDSRTILGESGAEQLLGQGDMLYMAGGGRITRIHGPFVSDQEVEAVVNFAKSQGEPAYLHAITEDDEPGEPDDADPEPGFAPGAAGDDLYDQAVALVAREQRCSVSFIQRHLQIGYNRSARIVERMEQEGVVSQANHVGKRDVLIGRSDF